MDNTATSISIFLCAATFLGLTVPETHHIYAYVIRHDVLTCPTSCSVGKAGVGGAPSSCDHYFEIDAHAFCATE
jgi:hypothetical protein